MTLSSGTLAERFNEGTMGRTVKVKVRPGGHVQFPSICANCSQPATEAMALTRRSGRRTRSIDVPLCAACFRELKRESGQEERLHRLGRAASVFVFLLAAILVFILFSGLLPLLASLFISLAVGTLVGLGVRTYFRRIRADAALPEKKAILASSQLVDFSWRATTFEFDNEEFSDRVEELNQEKLMEV
jgi:hypothetical protein